MPPTSKSPEERFWEKVDKSGDCWEWIASKTRDGYGMFRDRTLRKNMIKSHKWSWIYYFGGPGSLHVLHKCNNPGCVRPDHLYLGTHAQNMADIAKAGNHSNKLHPEKYYGSKNPSAKFTEEQVLTIRKMYEEGSSLNDLVNHFNAKKATIWAIVARKNWKHI